MEIIHGKATFTSGDCYKKNIWEKGDILVLKASILKPQYQEAKWQLFECNGGGFGCDVSNVGRAVFGKFLEDGEECRWDREQFIGVLTEEAYKTWLKIKDVL